MSRISLPNVSTSKLAVIGPTPLIKPLLKYFFNPLIVFGCVISAVSKANCSPYFVFINLPSNLKFCPTLISAILPLKVIYLSTPSSSNEITPTV
jgi:hypothetical protein